MTVPVDLVNPDVLQDPVEEFFRRGGIDVPEPEQTEGITKKQVALIATALAASFLVFRMLMHKELDQSIAPSSKGAAMKLIERSFFKIAPLWARAALPAAVAAYRLGSYDSATLSADELETLAQAYVKSLGEYINTTSAEAMLDGFQAQLNAKWSNELAWQRSVAGYGLDGPGTRTYIQSFTTGVKDGYIVDPVPQMSVKMVQTGLGMRAKRFGDTESWSAVQTGRNIVWMSQVVSGDLPEGTKKRWVTASDERVCPTCGPLDQRVVGLTQRFHSVDGKKFYAPGVHPNCRCRIELVYPEDYINRVEELVRKNRPGDPFNRDSDGHFASREQRGWSYREAMDDNERHTTAPRRVRLRELAPEEARPKQQTMVDTEQETKTEQKSSVFGTEPSVFTGTGTKSSVFAAPSVFSTPVRQRVTATARPKTETTTYYYLNHETGKFDPGPPPPPPPTGGRMDPIPDFYFSHLAVVEQRLKYYKHERNNPDNLMYTDGPEIGDVIEFDRDGHSYINDSKLTFDDAVMSDKERVIGLMENDIDNLRDYTAKILYGEDVTYGDLNPMEAEYVDEHVDQNDDVTASAPIIIYHFNDPRGELSDDGSYGTAYGRYKVMDIDSSPRMSMPPGSRDIRDVLMVELEYIEPS